MNAALRSSRGSALPETAIVLAFTLIVLFGMMQIVVLTYFQEAGDAATFVGAHEATIYAEPSAVASMEATMFPNVVAAAVTFSPVPAPTVNASPFSNIYGSNVTGGQTTRNGGFALVRPQNFQSYLQQTGSNAALFKGILGFENVPLSAGAVEGFYLTSNDQMDVQGVDPNATDQPVDPYDTSPFAPTNDTAGSNKNAPPYYVTTATMQFCSSPWAAFGGAPFGDTCNNVNAWALGLAEYLDDDNWGAPNGPGIGQNQVFFAMAAHQRVYADLINAFPAGVNDASLTALQEAIQTGSSATATIPGGASPFTGELWLYDEMAAYEQGQAPNAAPNWMGRCLINGHCPNGVTFDSKGVPTGPGIPAAWKNATPALVYEWDQPVIYQSGPGASPLSPLTGSQLSSEPGY